MKIEATDRRITVIDTTDSIPSRQYFKELGSAMDDEGAESYFRYLASMDLSGFDIRDRPITAGHFEMKLNGLDPEVKFIIEKCEDMESFSYDDFEYWARGKPVKYECSSRCFGKTISKIGIISKRIRKNTSAQYRLYNVSDQDATELLLRKFHKYDDFKLQRVEDLEIEPVARIIETDEDEETELLLNKSLREKMN